MKLQDVKNTIGQYMHLEDTGIINVSLATIIGNRMKLSNKIWLAIVGESSGGKSQILNPIMKSDPKYFIKIDDLTENTFLSGAQKGANSLLTKDKTNNMLVFSDLTVLFSKNSDSKNAILSQFRMIFDGHMTKHVGTTDEPLEWKGHMGVIAGCTPSIYRHFEEVADMGERFVYYRLRGNDAMKATMMMLNRTIYGNDVDDKIAGVFGEYIECVIKGMTNRKEEVVVSQDLKEHIAHISMFAELVRTPIDIDIRTREILSVPVPAMPMRTAGQLMAIAKALLLINAYEGYEAVDVKQTLDWLAFSLADENKRKALEVISGLNWEKGETINHQQVGDYIGLETKVAGYIMQKLAATGVLKREAGTRGLMYRFQKKEYHEIITRTLRDMKVDVPDAEYDDDEEVAGYVPPVPQYDGPF